MSRPTKEEMNSFVNALQLCIKTKIIGITEEKGDSVIIKFADSAFDDKKLSSFLQLVQGKFERKGKSYKFTNPKSIEWHKMTFFLMITRLNEENMVKLAEMDPYVEELIAKMGIRPEIIYIRDVKHASKIVFQTLSRKNMTIRELSEKTGLTQVSLSKFKAGNDIRLSNLIRISEALNLKLILR